MSARLLHAGRGTGWWWPGGPVVADGLRLWVDGEPFPLGRVEQVSAAGDALDVSLDDGRRAQVQGRRWRWRRPAPELPRVFASDGYLYREDDRGLRAIDVVDAGERAIVGPGGAVLVGHDVLRRGAAPGRTPQALPVGLLPATLRWSADGLRVAGVAEDERGAVVDLRTLRARRRSGVPAEVDVWWRDGDLVRDGETLVSGVREASPARWEGDLAGPGGVVWSLATGRKRFEVPAVALGATVGTPEGFVTIDWRTHRGWTVDPATGARSRRFRLPLEEEDAVVGAEWADGAVHVETALGERLRIVRGRVERGDRPVDAEEPVAVDTPVGPLEGGDSETVGGVTYGWNEDGWLLAWDQH